MGGLRWEWLVLAAGAVLIPVGCLLPLSKLPTLPNDKLLHFLAFGGMALMAGRLATSPNGVLLALLAVFVASWGIELLQNRVPGRKFCWRDMAANVAGIACAGVLLALLPPA
jgi:hypothetical protein